MKTCHDKVFAYKMIDVRFQLTLNKLPMRDDASSQATYNYTAELQRGS